jgi:hypothetical protein
VERKQPSCSSIFRNIVMAILMRTPKLSERQINVSDATIPVFG